MELGIRVQFLPFVFDVIVPLVTGKQLKIQQWNIHIFPSKFLFKFNTFSMLRRKIMINLLFTPVLLFHHSEMGAVHTIKTCQATRLGCDSESDDLI